MFAGFYSTWNPATVYGHNKRGFRAEVSASFTTTAWGQREDRAIEH